MESEASVFLGGRRPKGQRPGDVSCDKERQAWDASWAGEDFSPVWQTKTIPDEVRDAVESGWFQPGSSLLDIGCGDGPIAPWLAQQGFNVLGVDYSGNAIRRAKSAHLEVPGSLEFKVMDICQEAPSPSRFSALIDRGCFHMLPDDLRPAYIRNIELCSTESAKLLFFAHKWGWTFDQRVRDIETAFSPAFEVAKAATSMVGQVPGVAIWMVREKLGLPARDAV